MTIKGQLEPHTAWPGKSGTQTEGLFGIDFWFGTSEVHLAPICPAMLSEAATEKVVIFNKLYM